MAKNIQRPRLGQKIQANERLRRITRHQGLGPGFRSFWQRYAEARIPLKAKPVEGIYIGHRTYSNGRKWYGGDDEGNLYQADEWLEVWLIVPSARENPVPVMPEDTVWLDNG